jgi:hypothetical protein
MARKNRYCWNCQELLKGGEQALCTFCAETIKEIKEIKDSSTHSSAEKIRRNKDNDRERA